MGDRGYDLAFWMPKRKIFRFSNVLESNRKSEWVIWSIRNQNQFSDYQNVSNVKSHSHSCLNVYSDSHLSSYSVNCVTVELFHTFVLQSFSTKLWCQYVSIVPGCSHVCQCQSCATRGEEALWTGEKWSSHSALVALFFSQLTLLQSNDHCFSSSIWYNCFWHFQFGIQVFLAWNMDVRMPYVVPFNVRHSTWWFEASIRCCKTCRL